MPRFAANLTMMFTELPFCERFAAAAAAGFEAVEFLFPYAWPADTLATLLQQHGLQQSLFNLPPGDWERGERGMAALPSREQEFAESVELGLRYAAALGCKKLHAMAGITTGLDQVRCEQTYLANLRWAADRCAEQGITLVIEPLNNRDVPGYFLSRQREAARIIRLVERPNLQLQFDCYHAQIMEGDLTVLLRDLAPLIGHIQIASIPDRHEPDQGELNYAWLFKVIDEIGHPGFLGCEYNPTTTTTAGLAWVRPYLARPQ